MNGWLTATTGIKRAALRVAGARRWQLGVATDVLSSVGNFTVTIAIARTSGLGSLGMFAVAFSIYVLVTGTTRATVSETVISAPGWRSNFQEAGRRIVMLAGLSAGVTVLVGVITRSPYVVVVGLALPGLAIYDHVKIMSMSVWRPAIALRQEGVWTAVSALALLSSFVKPLEPTVTFAVWAGVGACLGFYNAWRHGIHVLPGWKVSDSAQSSRTSAGFGFDYLASSGVAQLVPSALAVVSGPSVVGALRGAGSMLSPITALTSPARSLIIPRMLADSDQSASTRIRRGVATTGLLASLVLSLGLVVLVLPDRAGRLLLGSNWEFAEPLLPALLCELLFAIASIVPMVGHRVAQAARRTLTIHLGVAPIRLAVVIAASVAGGAAGAAWALAGISMTLCGLWWISFVLIAQRHAERP